MTRPAGSFVGADRPANPAAEHLWFTDFTEYAADAQPDDWTQQSGWGVNQTVKVIDHGTFGRVLARTTNTWNADGGFLAWDTPGDIDGDVEVVVKIRATKSEAYDMVAVMCNNVEQCYASTDPSNSLSTIHARAVANHVGGTGAIDPSDRDSGKALNQWAWIRLRLEGTSLKVRVWADGEAEPTGWLSTLDVSTWLSEVGTVGKPGVAWVNVTDTAYVAAFGVSSDPSTDPAPMTADEAGADAFTATTRPTGSFAGAS